MTKTYRVYTSRSVLQVWDVWLAGCCLPIVRKCWPWEGPGKKRSYSYVLQSRPFCPRSLASGFLSTRGVVDNTATTPLADVTVFVFFPCSLKPKTPQMEHMCVRCHSFRDGTWNLTSDQSRHVISRSLLSSDVSLSVLQSVRLSRSCIVSRQLKISSNFFLGPVVPPF